MSSDITGTDLNEYVSILRNTNDDPACYILGD